MNVIVVVKKLVVYTLLAVVFMLSLGGLDTQGQYEHQIIGNYLSGEDLIYPYGIQVTDSKLFLLDQNRIKIFDKKTYQYLNQFSLSDPSVEAPPPDWKKMLISDLISDLFFNTYPSGFTNPIRDTFNVHYWHSFFLDEHENCIILGDGIIYRFDSESGKLIKTIDLNTILITITSFDDFQVSMYVKGDTIYLLQKITNVASTHILSPFSYVYAYVLSLDGVCEYSVRLRTETEDVHIQSFVFLSDINVFLIPTEFVLLYPDEGFQLFLSFYNLQGESIPFNKGEVFTKFEKVRVSSPSKFVAYCYEFSDRFESDKIELRTYRYTMNSFNEIRLEIQNNVDVKDKINYCVDFVCWGEEWYIINMNEVFASQVCYFQPTSQRNILQTTSKQGQIISSIAFTMDQNQNLLQANLGNRMMNWFDSNGSLISSEKSELPIRDMEVDANHHLFLLPESDNEIWLYGQNNHHTLVFNNGLLDQFKRKKILKLLIQHKSIYGLVHHKNSSIVLIAGNYDQVEKIDWRVIELQPPSIHYDELLLILDFAIISDYYVFLDSGNSCLYLYDIASGKYNRTIPLPTSENSLYTSLSLYPDGSYLLTDILQSCLVHVDQEGHLLETIGSKGQVEIGTTKEAYLEKPDQFYFPIRAKIKNNHIIVSDLYNCRYHVIPIKPFQINWQESSIQKKAFSIFSSESGSLHYELSTPSIISYEVTSTVPWLTIRNPTGSLSDKQIDYLIHGDKLTPWQVHQGEIRITFPEQWAFLNQTIPVSVNAIGSTVELTIGSIQAKVDGRWIAMELGSIPVIKQGRTCIGLRFLAEYPFRSHASIDYEAAIQRIKVTTKEHTIYMIVNHPIASVDGKTVSLDIPPFIQQGRTMIPLRFVSESLEAQVYWDSATQKVTIQYPGKEK